MPSPVGHSLIGLALGSAYLLPAGSWKSIRREAWSKKYELLACMAVANLPDVDYLPGLATGNLNAYHHYYTHTLGWIVVVALGLWLWLKAARPRATWRDAVFILALLASHLVADWLTDDGGVPFGIMAFWPISDRFTMSPVTIFWQLRKQHLSDFIQVYNARAVLVEMAWCLPLVLLMLAVKRAGNVSERVLKKM